MFGVPPSKKISGSDADATARRFARNQCARCNRASDVRRRKVHCDSGRCRGHGNRKDAFCTRSRHGISLRVFRSMLWGLAGLDHPRRQRDLIRLAVFLNRGLAGRSVIGRCNRYAQQNRAFLAIFGTRKRRPASLAARRPKSANRCQCAACALSQMCARITTTTATMASTARTFFGNPSSPLPAITS